MNYKPKTGKHIKCKICNVEFYIPKNRFKTAKFCSYYCMGQSSQHKFESNCKICNKKFSYIATREGKAKYCSRYCYHKAMHLKGTKENKCSECNNIFRSPPSHKRKYCSKICMWQAKKKIFSIAHSVSIRKALKRRGLLVRCHECGYNEVSDILGIHHKDGDRHNNSITNLIILCPNCHSVKHSKHTPHC